ncbi:hypothetical protein OIU79_012977 [Salix purpurea]|uniref:Uncharacterized protein n=1 Tax=Salix purpurea TaxID=77065 RepID=A0A9Q0Q4Z2_SALPP|nr:hypothetical protein OIU79_012977 [Salix purpurea]
MKASKSLGLNPPEDRKKRISDIAKDVDNINPIEPSVLSFSTASKIFLVASARLVMVSKSTAMTKICFLLLNDGNLPELLFWSTAFRVSFTTPLDHAKASFSILLFLSVAFPSESRELSFPLPPIFSPSNENFKFKDKSCISLKESPGESVSEVSDPSSFFCHCGCLGLQLAILDR